MEIFGLIIGIILIGIGLFTYMIDEFSGLLIIIIGFLLFYGFLTQITKSDTAEKYEEYLELKKEQERDSINKLHYKWNKDLDNKIKKLKNE